MNSGWSTEISNPESLWYWFGKQKHVGTTCPGPEYIKEVFMTRVLMKQLKCCVLVDGGCLTLTNPFPFSDNIHASVDASLIASVCSHNLLLPGHLSKWVVFLLDALHILTGT